jgi:hypothetical protein
VISPSFQDPAFVCGERPVKLRPHSVRTAIEIGTVYARLRENPLREPCRQRRITAFGNIKDFELGSRADTLRVSSTSERPTLLGGGVRLQRQTSLGDLGNVSLISGEVTFSVATGYSET